MGTVKAYKNCNIWEHHLKVQSRIRWNLPVIFPLDFDFLFLPLQFFLALFKKLKKLSHTKVTYKKWNLLPLSFTEHNPFSELWDRFFNHLFKRRIKIVNLWRCNPTILRTLLPRWELLVAHLVLQHWMVLKFTKNIYVWGKAEKKLVILFRNCKCKLGNSG